MNDLKPWQRPLPDEERVQFLNRLTHSCYRCGHQEDDLGALAEHEDRCAGGET
jgi:ribosomal protein S27AE